MIYKILPLTLVSGKINLAMFLSFVMSVIVNFTLNLDAIFEKYRFVPPYMSSPHRMWSPACNSWTTAVVAARPDAKVRQCLPLSSEAMHFCNTFLVGFPHLLYSNPCREGEKWINLTPLEWSLKFLLVYYKSLRSINIQILISKLLLHPVSYTWNLETWQTCELVFICDN